MAGANICTYQFDQKELKKNDLSSISLNTLIFHVTGLCNLKCRHCWQNADADERLNGKNEKVGDVSPADLTDVLREAKTLGLTCVKFTGGEPFLHPRIMDYLEVTDRENLSVGIETNGTLIDEDRVERLKHIKKLFVAVSIDGDSATVHDHFRGVEGAFDRSIDTIERLTQVDIPVQIIMSLYRENAQNIASMVQLAEACGVQSIKINPIQPMGRGRDLTGLGDALPVAELLQLAEYCRETLNPGFKGELYFSLPLAFQPFLEIQYQKFSLCRIFQILGLMPNGDLSFCGIGNIARAMVVGNIHRDNLVDLWQKAPLLVELRQSLPQKLKGICSRCILKSLCLGECRAQAYDQSNDLMGAYWICQQAHEAGLFPVSRLVPDTS